MPYKRRLPVPEEEMLEPAGESDMRKQRWSGHHTLCQTLREIYALADTIVSHPGNADIRLKCRLAMAYSKAMNSRLQYYHDKYEPEK